MTAPQTPAVADSTSATAGPRVVGLDLSLTSTGVASNYGWTDRIRTKLTGHERLQHILDEIAAYTASADLVVIESLAFHGHDTEGASAGLAWLVRHRLWWKGKHYALVTPGQRMIYATGTGRADKDQVLAAVIRRYPAFDVASNDEADALILAAMGARHLGHPIDDLPLTHLRALDKVTWPETAGAA